MESRRYAHIRHETELLCSNLKPEDYVVQVALFASPVKWHLGHTTWFFETFVLKEFAKNYAEFNPQFEFLFNSYYEAIGSRLPREQRGILFRPTIEEIFHYRQHVDEAMIKYLDGDPSDEAKERIELGLQHEQQHQELLTTDTKYLFFQNPLKPVWDETKTIEHLTQKSKLNWPEVDQGYYNIGFDGEGFCFDNELAKHTQFIHPFKIMDRPVINAEYLDFIEDGGYENFRYWLSDGWNWRMNTNTKHPLYWLNQDNEWNFFHLDGIKKLNPLLPVMHINYYEADAYANWKKQRLPTEFEWEVAARYHRGAFNPLVWEWTRSAYLPYPGYKTAKGAIGEYNGKFMVNQMVLRGGSFASPEGHIRTTYRNFFPPDLQWQFSGLRLVKDDKKTSS